MNLNDVSQVVYRALDVINARSVREFSVPPQSFVGCGAVARCGEAMAERGLNHVFIMVDGFLHQHGIDEGVYRSLQAANIQYKIITYAGGEPTTQVVEAAAAQLLDAKCDSVLAIGGGSVLDAAKVTAMLAANANLQIESLTKPATQLQRRLPLVAIPTTAGTGSESTNIAVITNAETHQKQLLVHSQLIPDLAIIDANLTLDIPPFITAITGIDTLTHSVETYIAKHANDVTKSLAYRAITLVGEALPHAVGQGNNIAARESMMLASFMAGMAFSNGGLGLCHAMAHQIGGKYLIPHGMCNAILLPAVMRFNQLVCKKEFAEIGHALTGKRIEADETIAAVQQLIYDVGLIKSLTELGGKSEDMPQLAEAALQDGCLATNPRTVTKDQVIAVYQDALTV